MITEAMTEQGGFIFPKLKVSAKQVVSGAAGYSQWEYEAVKKALGLLLDSPPGNVTLWSTEPHNVKVHADYYKRTNFDRVLLMLERHRLEAGLERTLLAKGAVLGEYRLKIAPYDSSGKAGQGQSELTLKIHYPEGYYHMLVRAEGFASFSNMRVAEKWWYSHEHATLYRMSKDQLIQVEDAGTHGCGFR